MVHEEARSQLGELWKVCLAEGRDGGRRYGLGALRNRLQIKFKFGPGSTLTRRPPPRANQQQHEPFRNDEVGRRAMATYSIIPIYIYTHKYIYIWYPPTPWTLVWCDLYFSSVLCLLSAWILCQNQGCANSMICMHTYM